MSCTLDNEWTSHTKPEIPLTLERLKRGTSSLAESLLHILVHSTSLYTAYNSDEHPIIIDKLWVKNLSFLNGGFLGMWRVRALVLWPQALRHSLACFLFINIPLWTYFTLSMATWHWLKTSPALNCLNFEWANPSRRSQHPDTPKNCYTVLSD